MTRMWEKLNNRRDFNTWRGSSYNYGTEVCFEESCNFLQDRLYFYLLISVNSFQYFLAQISIESCFLKMRCRGEGFVIQEECACANRRRDVLSSILYRQTVIGCGSVYGILAVSIFPLWLRFAIFLIEIFFFFLKWLWNLELSLVDMQMRTRTTTMRITAVGEIWVQRMEKAQLVEGELIAKMMNFQDMMQCIMWCSCPLVRVVVFVLNHRRYPNLSVSILSWTIGRHTSRGAVSFTFQRPTYILSVSRVSSAIRQ